METPKEKYKTARAFKVAIADRLRALANKSGEPHLDLYRRVAIDRFLARIDWTIMLTRSHARMRIRG